jgi:isochorismate pyruvate lyase
MNGEFQFVSSGSKWERANGYSRAVRTGRHIYFSGTTATNPDGTIHAPGDGAAQFARCMEIIERALAELGASRFDIVRSRVYTTDIAQHTTIGAAHGAYFGDHRPCLTLVGVAALVHPDMVVEVECEAIRP